MVSGEVLHDGGQLVQALVEQLVAATVALQGGQHLVVIPLDGDELQNLLGLLPSDADVLPGEEGGHLLGADLLQLVHGAHDVPGLIREAQHGVEAVQNLPVVHPDLEPLQAQGGEGLIDDGGDLRLVDDVQLAVANDVDVRLVELPEAAPLGALPPVHLADLEAAEGEGQLPIVEGHVLGQGHGEIKAEGQVGVPLQKAVDLLFRLAAGLGQQHLAGLDDGGVQGGEAVEGIGAAQQLHHAVKLYLALGQKLHKAGQGAGFLFCHVNRTPYS